MVPDSFVEYMKVHIKSWSNTDLDLKTFLMRWKSKTTEAQKCYFCTECVIWSNWEILVRKYDKSLLKPLGDIEKNLLSRLPIEAYHGRPEARLDWGIFIEGLSKSCIPLTKKDLVKFL